MTLRIKSSYLPPSCYDLKEGLASQLRCPPVIVLRLTWILTFQRDQIPQDIYRYHTLRPGFSVNLCVVSWVVILCYHENNPTTTRYKKIDWRETRSILECYTNDKIKSPESMHIKITTELKLRRQDVHHFPGWLPDFPQQITAALSAAFWRLSSLLSSHSG